MLNEGSGGREVEGWSVGGIGIGNNFRYRCIFCVGFARGHELEGLVAVALWLVRYAGRYLPLSAGPTWIGRNVGRQLVQRREQHTDPFLKPHFWRAHSAPSTAEFHTAASCNSHHVRNPQRKEVRIITNRRFNPPATGDGQHFTSELMTKMSIG